MAATLPARSRRLPRLPPTGGGPPKTERPQSFPADRPIDHHVAGPTPSTQISPGARGTIATTPPHNHSPPSLDGGPDSDKQQSQGRPGPAAGPSRILGDCLTCGGRRTQQQRGRRGAVQASVVAETTPMPTSAGLPGGAPDALSAPPGVRRKRSGIAGPKFARDGDVFENEQGLARRTL